MINSDVSRLLRKIREEVDGLKSYQDDLDDLYNEGLMDAMIIIESYINKFEITPNDIKEKAGMYHN